MREPLRKVLQAMVFVVVVYVFLGMACECVPFTTITLTHNQQTSDIGPNDMPVRCTHAVYVAHPLECDIDTGEE